jgi:hypothetical protein
VRFIILEILDTGVLAFECFRNSAWCALVQATDLRFFVVFLANEIPPGLGSGVSNTGGLVTQGVLDQSLSLFATLKRFICVLGGELYQLPC